MYIDPRVARGHARRFGEEVSRYKGLEIFDKVFLKARAKWKPGMTGRDAYRFMSGTLKPLADRVMSSYPLVRDYDLGFTLYMGLFELPRPGGGIDVLFVQHSSSDDPLMALVTKIEFTLHAIQRAMQRLGSTEKSVIHRQIYEALVEFPLMYASMLKDGWRQFGIPCGAGIFVGSYDSFDLVVSTFLHASDLGYRTSRWLRFRSDMMSCLELSKGPDTRLREYLALLRSVPERYPFLLEEYEERSDPEDAAWNSCR